MGGHIILRVNGGFTDALSLLWKNIQYAKIHNRTIIFCLNTYKATNLDSIIDFSDFPVVILAGEAHIKQILFSSIEPTCFADNPYRDSDANILLENGYLLSNIGGVSTGFDMNKTYPDDVLLIFQGFGNDGGMLEVFKCIKFKPAFIDKFYEQRNMFTTFIAIHIRATDYPGYNEEADTLKVDKFLKMYPDKLAYLACDNSKFVEKLCIKHSNVVRPLSYKKIDKPYYALHYSFGQTDPECLSNAIIDILMCASSSEFLESRGGFSKLIQQLNKNKELLNKLLQK